MRSAGSAIGEPPLYLDIVDYELRSDLTRADSSYGWWLYGRWLHDPWFALWAADHNGGRTALRFTGLDVNRADRELCHCGGVRVGAASSAGTVLINRKLLSRVVLGCCLFIACGRCHAADIDVGILAKILEDRELALRLYSVKVDNRVERRHDDGQIVDLLSRQSVLVDSGRIRCEHRSEDIGVDGKLFEQLAVGVYDGDQVRVIRGTRDKWSNGWIAADFVTFPWDTPVSAYLTHYDNAPLSSYVSKPEFQIVKNQQDNLICEVGPFDGEGGRTMIRLHINLTTLAFVRGASLIQFAGEDAWREYYVVENSDFAKDLLTGISLPAKSYRKLSMIVDSASEPTIVFENHVSLSAWNTEPGVEEALFKMEFPAGALIEDTINGQQYIAVSIGDQSLIDMLSVAQGITGNTGFGNGWRTLAVTGAIGAVLLLLVAWRRRVGAGK